MTCKCLQFVKPPELMTDADLAGEIESITTQRESTRKGLLGLRVTERRLRVLISRYDRMLLAAVDAAAAPLDVEREARK
jgi:hypothetical protein